MLMSQPPLMPADKYARLAALRAGVVASMLAIALALALVASVARAAGAEPGRVFPATEMGGPMLPANAVLLKRAGPRGDSGVLRLGVAQSGYPPLEIMTTGGQVAGITMDYAALIGKYLNKRVEVVTAANFAEVLELLKAGEIDMVGSVARTASRESYAAFSTPFMSSTPVVIQRREAEKRDAAQLGTVIAVEKGSAVIEFIKRDFPSAKMVELASPLAALQLVARGQADSYVGDLITTAYLIETRYLSSLRVTSAAGFSTGELRFAVSNTRLALARSIDSALAGISQAEHDNIRQRWLPFATLASVQSAHIDLSPQEQAWLKAHPEIRLGAEPSYIPFSTVGEDGKFEGLAADYLKLIAERTGLNVKLQPGLSWTGILDGIKARTLDITPAVVDTPERRAFMLFAGPIVALPSVFVMPVGSKLYVDGFASLSGQRMALVKSGPVTLRVERDFPGIVPVYVTNTTEALATVASGDADVALSNINFITREIESKYLGTLKIAGTVADSPTELNIGVRSDWPELQSIVRKGINTISRTEHEAIRQKWLSVKFNQGFEWREVLKFAIPLLLALLAIITVILVANRRLARQFEKTKAAENQVAYQLALQSSLLDSVPMPVFVVDPQARFTDCNLAFESAFGVKRASVRGKTLLQWVNPAVKEIQRLHAELLSLLARGGTNSSEYLLPMPDGRTVHFQGAARAFALPNGAAGGLVASATDFTQERARQQELADARDKAESATLAKSAFLATMSHEIRTPMNGVLGMLELLAHTPLNPEQRNSVAVAQESGRSLLILLSDVLDLSKIEANRLTIDSAPASLRAVAELVIQTLANGARSKGLKVRLFIAPNVAIGHVCDALRVRQILFNLLGNAIKFTRQGWVSLRITATDGPHAHPPSQRVVFEVSDSGIGIEPQAQARLFAPFEQAEPSVGREFGGTGLGLAICHRLSELMGAQLSMESQPGVGSTLRLEGSFTVADLPLPAQPTGTDAAPPVKVLILADDGADQDALTAYLGERQFDALVPSLLPANAQQLAQLLRAQLPQCAIVLPALLARLGVTAGALEAMLRHTGAAVVEPAVVSLSDLQQGLPSAQRQLCSQPILPSAVSALLDEWRGAGNPATLGPAAAPAGFPVLPAAANAPRILVAEDHPTNQAIVSKQLAMIGCAATLCGDGESALAAWRGGCQYGAVAFSALLVDCHMPGMDGYALARQIRSAEADATVGTLAQASPVRIPIIALTADTSSGVRLRCAEAGMDDLLTKPVDIPGLRAMLGRWIAPFGPGAAQGEGIASLASAPPVAPDPASNPAFDWARLVGEMGGRDAARMLIKDYVQCTGQDIERLAAAAHDPLQARRMAHRIKGAARLLGAARIEDIAARLESIEPVDSLTAGTVSDACTALSEALANIQAALPHSH